MLGDAVLNHRCAHFQSPNGVWNRFGGKLDWDPRAIVSDDPHFQARRRLSSRSISLSLFLFLSLWLVACVFDCVRICLLDSSPLQGQGNTSQGDFFHAAPNIDHTQAFVRKDICEWMQWLRAEVGYDGWRLDFVRGFSGVHVKEYMNATDPEFSVGCAALPFISSESPSFLLFSHPTPPRFLPARSEYWDTLVYQYDSLDYNQDAHRQRIVNWINAAGGTAGAFDVTTKGILHAALERREYWRLSDVNGKPPGVMGWWPSRAVTFIENHDTGSTQGHWRFPQARANDDRTGTGGRRTFFRSPDAPAALLRPCALCLRWASVPASATLLRRSVRPCEPAPPARLVLRSRFALAD